MYASKQGALMSSTITAYAISLDTLESAIGSNDEDLLSDIAEQRAGFLESIDDINDEAELTCLDALTHLVNGADVNDDYGYLYGYAVEALCMHLGHVLDNVSGISGSADWIEEPVALLAVQKIPLTL